MRLERVPPAFFALSTVSAALALNVRAVTGVELTRTPHGYTGRSEVKERGQVYRQQFLLNADGIYTGGECGCGKKGCVHLARALLSPPLERALEASGREEVPHSGPVPAPARPTPDAGPDDGAASGGEALPLATPLRQ
ncbi:ATP-dependent helicase, partial [Deinococcus sp. MIMF12]|nr:ATP-dependent helicase [Deinococcus rhizophilus]